MYGQMPFSHQRDTSLDVDLTQRVWSDPRWNANDLNDANILDYFCNRENPFFDVQSINEMIRMQQINLQYQDVNAMSGTQFVLVVSDQPLFVIRKINRVQHNPPTALEDYYVIGGKVYQAPDLSSLINSKITGCLHHINNAFQSTISHLQYNSSKGFHWKFDTPVPDNAVVTATNLLASPKASVVPAASHAAPVAGADARISKPKPKAAKKEEEDPLDAKSTWFQRTRVEQLLIKLSERFPVAPDQQIQPETTTSGPSTTTTNSTTSGPAPSTTAPPPGGGKTIETTDVKGQTESLKRPLAIESFQSSAAMAVSSSNTPMDGGKGGPVAKRIKIEQ